MRYGWLVKQSNAPYTPYLTIKLECMQCARQVVYPPLLGRIESIAYILTPLIHPLKRKFLRSPCGRFLYVNIQYWSWDQAHPS